MRGWPVRRWARKTRIGFRAAKKWSAISTPRSNRGGPLISSFSRIARKKNFGLTEFIRQDKAHIVEPPEHRFEDVLIEAQSDPSLNVMATDLSAAGLTAVWATENTRKIALSGVT